MTDQLDLGADIVTLTRQLCDIESVSRDEGRIADAVEAALRALPHLSVSRTEHTIVARTDLGRDERVVLAGHLDTVPLTDPPNLPTRLEERDGEEVLWGRGTVDMKGGVAVQLKVAASVPEPSRDLTFLFYEAEEIEERYNGLKALGERDPEVLREADLAILFEGTRAEVEGGCKGTLRVEVRTTGTAAHSARPWRGHNAIHDAADVLQRLRDYTQHEVEVDGLTYHEALQAVGIRGGIAGNVVPDECVVTVNYRFAPDKSGEQALAHVQDVFDGYELTVTDLAEGARPGLDRPAAQAFVAALGVPVGPKEGWTDVARFSALGVPAINFGPGDPGLAHQADEHTPTAQLRAAEAAVLRWLA